MKGKKPFLGLNLIVAPDEEEILERCLNSCKGDLFDEIVVTLGTPKDDPKLRAVAEKFGAKTFHFKWIDDFSAARNFSFSKNTSEYIMWCMTPDSLVHTDRGLRPICDIKVGDKVLTHTGRYMPVTKIYCQPYSGEIIRVSGKYSKGSVGVTPNHEFYGCKSYQCKIGLKFCKADCKKQYSKRYLKKYGKICLQCKRGYTGYDKHFTAIDKYVEGDIVTLPRLKQVIFKPYFLHLPDKDKVSHDLPKTVEVTPELMRLFGYYVAGGAHADNHISFCFHKNETSYHKDVIAIMEKFFGMTGKSCFTESNGCNIIYNSIVLSAFFKELFNGAQYQRRIPNEFLGLSDQHLSEFIKGYYRGDGGESPDSFAMTTTSPYLVEQVLLILTRFGIMGEVVPYKTKVAWKIRVGGKSVAIFQEMISEIHSKFLKSEFNKYFYVDSSFIYHQIEEYHKETYEGNVYNLEVEEDHSYVADYMITHNCDADDVIKPDEYKKLLDLKPQLSKWDIVILDYVYSHDEKDNPVLVLPRERIVKNCDYIKWHDPIHEYMNLNVPQNRLIRFHINVDHYRVKASNPARNIESLKKVYESDSCSERIKFYYGKELADYGLWDKAIEVLEPYIKDGKDFQDNLTNACIKLARYYIDKKNFSAAKAYALKGLRFNSIYAENYVILGNIFEHENDPDTAASYYKEALNKKLEGGMSQIVDYYGFIPAAKLALLYNAQKEYEDGIKYCELALKYKPDDASMIELLKLMKIEAERLSKGSVLQENDIEAMKNFFASINLNASVMRNNMDFSDIRLNRIRHLELMWFIPMLDLNNPSTRIRRYNVHNKLKDMGIKSRIITNYYSNNVFEIRNMVEDASVAIFTQYSKKDLEIMKHLKGSGIKCVFDHCEALFNYPFEADCMKEANLITCCSTKLSELTNEYGYMHTVVIKDAVEKIYDGVVYKDRYSKPKAVYVGMGGNSWLVNEWLKDAIESAGYDIVTITEWDNATKKWAQDTWMNDMLECDVALCPQRVDVQPAKSSIKATVAMALGMPVVCSPLQAYKEIIVHGENGFICDTKEEWKEALIKLKDPDIRKRVGEAGKKAVENYSLDFIAGQWVITLTDLINDKLVFPEPQAKVEVKDRPLVDVIVASYNNVEYLKMCINSIQINTLYPYHIIISDGGSNEETWEYLRALKGITVIGEKGKRMSFSETCNAGIQASNTKYFVILNSDVIVSKCWLTNLVSKMETVDRLASCGVLSNCDRGWLHGVKGKPVYSMLLEKSGIDLHPAMKIDEIKPHVEELYKFMEKSNKEYKGKFVEQEWVAVYATIFARCAINEVGLFDQLYKNGCEDLDLMKRLSKFGYKTGQAIDSFVFHFGGISRGAYQDENRESYDKEDRENHIKYKMKWDKPRVVIWTGPAWEPWNKAKVDEGMAGSETWASYLAREFVKRGFRTTIYNDLLIDNKKGALLDPVLDEKGEKIGDVIYRDYRMLKDDVEYDVIDYFIASRSVEPLKLNIHTLRNYVMVHDIWLSADKNYDIMSWRVDKYAYLSNWHRDFLSKHHGILSDKMFLTANGQDMSLYSDVDTYTKKNQAIYSSSPDRGLYQLLKMLPTIRKEVPDFELIVAYGFFNWESMAKMRNDLESLNFIDEIKKLMNQPGVKYVGRINKKELADYEKESKVWLFPTWFSETFCISSVSAGLSKCSIVSTDYAGLSTTVGSSGVLLSPEGLSRNGEYPKSYTDKFIEEAVKMLTDEAYRKEWADKAYNKMKEYTWSNVVDGWIKQFNIK